jgi:hypothetical protein
MISRQKKYIAEYVSGQPKCGSVLDIDDEDLEPLKGQLAKLALQQKLDLAASGESQQRRSSAQLARACRQFGCTTKRPEGRYRLSHRVKVEGNRVCSYSAWLCVTLCKTVAFITDLTS